jgi:hypothetical protein
MYSTLDRGGKHISFRIRKIRKIDLDLPDQESKFSRIRLEGFWLQIFQKKKREEIELNFWK